MAVNASGPIDRTPCTARSNKRPAACCQRAPYAHSDANESHSKALPSFVAHRSPAGIHDAASVTLVKIAAAHV